MPERLLPQRIVLFVRAALASLVAAVVLTTPLGGVARATDGCLSQPKLGGPQGSHWYYRVDRTNNRRCWYLGAQGLRVHPDISAKPHPMANPVSHTTAQTPSKPPIAKASNVIAAKPSTVIAEKAPTVAVAKTSTVTTGKNIYGGEVFSALWQRASGGSIELEPALSRAYAEGDATTDPEAEMPLIWPVLTPAELAAASARAPDAMVRPQHMALLFVGALAFAAVVGRVILKDPAA
jgi:hypothetical protein